MVRHYYPELFKDEPEWLPRAIRAASITWEFTEYLVDGLGVTDLGAKVPPTTVAFHDACHGLRLMHLQSQARDLAAAVEGVTVTEVKDADVCCGFGGLFSVKMPQISGAMLRDKVENIAAGEAEVILTSDCSCMTQINGGLSRQQKRQRAIHIADLLADGLK